MERHVQERAMECTKCKGQLIYPRISPCVISLIYKENEFLYKNCKIYKGDIGERDFIKTIFSENKIDYVIHAAALKQVNAAEYNPIEFIKTNILGTTFLLEGARNADIDRFVFAGSIYSYGAAGNLYTTSKTASELIIKNYKLIYGQKFTILRYATAYGPRNREVDAVSIFVRRALKNLNLI